MREHLKKKKEKNRKLAENKSLIVSIVVCIRETVTMTDTRSESSSKVSLDVLTRSGPFELARSQLPRYFFALFEK